MGIKPSKLFAIVSNHSETIRNTSKQYIQYSIKAACRYGSFVLVSWCLWSRAVPWMKRGNTWIAGQSLTVRILFHMWRVLLMFLFLCWWRLSGSFSLSEWRSFFGWPRYLCQTCFNHARNIPEPCQVFPACQVRVVGFYIRALLRPPPSSMLPPRRAPFPAPDRSGHCRTPTASSQSMWALLESTGSPAASSQSQTSTASVASSRSPWALPDPNRQVTIAVSNAGCQKEFHIEFVR